MKKILFSILITGLTSISLFSQNTVKKWYLMIGTHAVDHTSVRGVFDGYFDTKDWSATPFGKIAIGRNLNRSFALDLEASVGEIDNKRLNLKDEFMTTVGLGLRYKFANGYILKERSWFDPYLRVGAGYHSFDYDGYTFTGVTDSNGDYLNDGTKVNRDNFMVNMGVGFNIWFTENFGINIASQYNWMPKVGNDYIDFFQHSVGLAFRFGPNDKDKDGILDKDDECPNVWGLKEFNGCPDTDGDGIEDRKDDCPTVPGPKENNGCPWPDRDGDTVLDKDDDCPDVPGLVELKGCPRPEVKPEVKPEPIYPISFDDVLFDFDKYTLKAEANSKVEEAAKIIKEHPNNQYVIVGHTDGVGTDAYNNKLSERRAQSVLEALKAKGVDVSTIKVEAAGKSQPKCTNDTKEGRQCNRRVEIDKLNK